MGRHLGKIEKEVFLHHRSPWWRDIAATQFQVIPAVSPASISQAVRAGGGGARQPPHGQRDHFPAQAHLLRVRTASWSLRMNKEQRISQWVTVILDDDDDDDDDDDGMNERKEGSDGGGRWRRGPVPGRGWQPSVWRGARVPRACLPFRAARKVYGVSHFLHASASADRSPTGGGNGGVAGGCSVPALDALYMCFPWPPLWLFLLLEEEEEEEKEKGLLERAAFLSSISFFTSSSSSSSSCCSCLVLVLFFFVFFFFLYYYYCY